METKLKIKENWTALKKELKQKYVALTDSELTYHEGREDELVATISKKIGKTKDEVSNFIKELQTKMAVRPFGERERVDAEKSNAAVKSYSEREGILAEKSKAARNLAGEGLLSFRCGEGGSPNISCIACWTCFSEDPLLTRLLYVNAVFFFRTKVI